MYVIGIDPGKTGAAAHINEGMLIKVVPFEKDITRCRGAISTDDFRKPIVFIEMVTASPNMGVVGAFTFGRWAEVVETTAILLGAEVHKVRPQVWQNAIGLYAAGDKKKLYTHAQRLYSAEYKLKMFNKASSDAVLIAHYGWRYMENKNEK